MNEPQKPARKSRKWIRRLRLLALLFGVVLIAITLLGFYLYHNLTGVVVWFANRSHPRLMLDLQHAGFVNSHQIELRNISLKPDASHEPALLIEKAVIDFKWNDLWKNHRIASIQVENPTVTVTDALLDSPSQPAAAGKTTLTSPDGLWQVDEFKVTGGKGEINISGSPLIHFGFASDMHGIYLSSEIQFSRQAQTLNVSGIEFLSKDPKPRKFGTIRSIDVNFTLDHIAQNKVDAVNIRTPSLWLTPELLAAFDTNSTGTKTAALSPGAAAAPAIPWTIGKLVLLDGELFVKGFGNEVPQVSMKFSLDEDDLQLFGGQGELAQKPHKAEIWDIRTSAAFAPTEPFLWIGSVEVDFTSSGLFAGREIAGLTITSLDFQIGQKFRSLMAAVDQKSAANTPAAGAAHTIEDSPAPWKIGKLTIYNGRASLTDLGPELPDIAFKLDTELNNVALSGEIRHASKEIEEVTISDLTIPSPRDPFTPVLNFTTIRLRFSLAQILDKEIDQVVLEKPTIFVGEQLFWYGDELKRRQAAGATPATAQSPQTQTVPDHAGWRINKFIVEKGRLTIANAGQAGVTMPFYFSSEADNLQFNNLSDLQLKVKLVVKQGDYEFPSYQIAFKQLRGSLDFGLPPGSGARDLEQTLRADGATWKQFGAQELWLSVTYDSAGIYGKFGGAGYKGYVTGGFQFYMLPDTPWSGWVSGTGIDLKPLTDILAPQNFQMSGPADFNIEMNGQNHEVQRVTGNFRSKTGGKLKIAKLDAIIKEIPATWNSIKQGTTRIALETLRDFDYTTENGDFWYAGQRGRLTLKMRGPYGSRNFDVTLHGN